MTNTQNKQTSTANEKSQTAESQLYNLLFAGRISIREYLQRIKDAGSETKAA
jgi:hypothetical protein